MVYFYVTANLLVHIKMSSEYDMQLFSSNRTDDLNTSIESKTKRIVGFFIQIKILSWKNYILSKRDKKGLISEIMAPIGMLLILLIIRISVSVEYKKEQDFDLKDVLDNFTRLPDRNLILFYPNNSFVEKLVYRGINFIENSKHEKFTG